MTLKSAELAIDRAKPWHSGEGRNPFAADIAWCARRWIPAFAGMTPSVEWRIAPSGKPGTTALSPHLTQQKACRETFSVATGLVLLLLDLS